MLSQEVQRAIKSMMSQEIQRAIKSMLSQEVQRAIKSMLSQEVQRAIKSMLSQEVQRAIKSMLSGPHPRQTHLVSHAKKGEVRMRLWILNTGYTSVLKVKHCIQLILLHITGDQTPV
jgi:hypothetical protein